MFILIKMKNLKNWLLELWKLDDEKLLFKQTPENRSPFSVDLKTPEQDLTVVEQEAARQKMLDRQQVEKNARAERRELEKVSSWKRFWTSLTGGPEKEKPAPLASNTDVYRGQQLIDASIQAVDAGREPMQTSDPALKLALEDALKAHKNGESFVLTAEKLANYGKKSAWDNPLQKIIAKYSPAKKEVQSAPQPEQTQVTAAPTKQNVDHAHVNTTEEATGELLTHAMNNLDDKSAKV